MENSTHVFGTVAAYINGFLNDKGAKMENSTHVFGTVAAYINGFLNDKIALSLDPTIAYDYQALLVQACCPSCGQEIKWRIAPHVNNQDDKFCQGDCCGMRYSMIPDRVRIIAMPQATEDAAELYSEEDFMRELENLK